MKKIIYLLSMLFVSIAAMAQLKVTTIEKSTEIGKVAPMGSLFAEITKRDSTYIFTYKDVNFVQIAEYKSFTFNEKDFEEIYKLFTEMGAAKDGETKIVGLESGESLILDYRKSLGTIYVTILHQKKSGVTGKIPYMSGKQLKKLFGKKD